jgi:pimeloyl-ACP methyl ester carboxylesterase
VTPLIRPTVTQHIAAETIDMTATTSTTIDPRVRPVALHSALLGVTRTMYVYLPPDLAPGERVPAVFFLRGHEREWVNPHEDQGRGGTVIDVYERLRAAGSVGPLLLVFPGLASHDNCVPTLLTNMRAPELAAGVPGIGSGRFEDHFFGEVLPLVDARFPSDGRRALVGFSLGGAMAAKAALRRPELFAAVAAYDGTFLYATDRGRRVRLRDRVLSNPMLDPVFGAPRDIAFVAANSPASMALRAPREALARVRWLVAYGPQALEPWQANYYRGEHFVACLRARGVPNNLAPGTFPGGPHTWRTADAFAECVLPLIDGMWRPEKRSGGPAEAEPPEQRREEKEITES